MDGLYPLTLRHAVRDRGQETIRSAIDALNTEIVKFTYYDEIRIATCIVTSSSTTSSSEGKQTNTTERKCPNCHLKGQSCSL